jgi:pentatricopeptide repeat protein
MLFAGLQSDARTMVVLMSDCAKLDSLSVAYHVHGFLKKGCEEMNFHVQNALTNMYAKCGSVNQAHTLFLETCLKDIIPYNVMITALAHHGYLRDALEFFNEIAEEGLQPNTSCWASS